MWSRSEYGGNELGYKSRSGEYEEEMKKSEEASML